MTKTQRTIKRILVPTDLSSQSDKAIEYGLALAQRFGAHLTLLYVFREPYAAQYVRGPSANNSSLEERESCRKAIKAVVDRARELYPDCSALFGYGEPNEEIIKAAGEGEFDLAIISTHHYNWLMRLAYGSDADQILHHAPCPILVLNVDEEVDFHKKRSARPRAADLGSRPSTCR